MESCSTIPLGLNTPLVKEIKPSVTEKRELEIQDESVEVALSVKFRQSGF